MIKQKQKYGHDPDNGITGDCYRTALACMLEMDCEEVPHVFTKTDDPREIDQQWKELRKWLREVHKLYLFNIPYDMGNRSVEHALKFLDKAHHGQRMMFSGQSKNGTNHIVIIKDGKIEWDPALDESGIIGPSDDGCYWITLLAI